MEFDKTLKMCTHCSNCTTKVLYGYNDFKGRYFKRKSVSINYYMYVPCPLCGLDLVSFKCSKEKYEELSGDKNV